MTRTRRWGWLWCVALGVGTAVGSAALLQRVQSTCDPIGGPGPGNAMFVLFFLMPLTALFVAGVAGVLCRVIGGRSRGSVALAGATTLVFAALTVWMVIALVYNGDLAVAEYCPSGLPRWWPAWLPL